MDPNKAQAIAALEKAAVVADAAESSVEGKQNWAQQAAPDKLN